MDGACDLTVKQVSEVIAEEPDGRWRPRYAAKSASYGQVVGDVLLATCTCGYFHNLQELNANNKSIVLILMHQHNLIPEPSRA